MGNHNENKLGKAVKQARIQAHFTQEQLAEMLYISPTHLKSIESGTRNPSYMLLEKMATLLTLSLDALFAKDPDSNQTIIAEVQNMLRQCTRQQPEILAAMINGLLHGR